MAAEFPHYSDPQVLRRESDHNQMALYEQAARLRLRREAGAARAAFLGARYAGGTDPATKQPATLAQLLANHYPDAEG